MIEKQRKLPKELNSLYPFLFWLQAQLSSQGIAILRQKQVHQDSITSPFSVKIWETSLDYRTQKGAGEVKCLYGSGEQGRSGLEGNENFRQCHSKKLGDAQ